MPIYEFKCLKCNEYFEWLLMNSDEEVTLRCPKCKSEDFERIISTTHYAIGSSGADSKVKSQTRNCSSGTCTTYEIPGPTR